MMRASRVLFQKMTFAAWVTVANCVASALMATISMELPISAISAHLTTTLLQYAFLCSYQSYYAY